MVIKTMTRKKKGKVSVSKLKVNKETVKNLTGDQKRNVRGGAIRRGDDTKLQGTCTIIRACN